MGSQIFKLLITILASLFLGGMVYIVVSQNDDFIIQRLKKGHAVKKKKGIWDDLLELTKPFTKANLKSEKKDTTKQLFVKLGMSAAENDVMDFENRRVLGLLVTLVLSFFGAIIVGMALKSAINDSVVLMCMMSLFVCAPCYTAYMWTTWKLRKRLKKKEKAFEKYFPDAIDLLCVCVEAGLSIDGAIERVGREFSNFSYDVGYEFNRIAKDMLSGVSKQDALRGLAERVDSGDIQSFVAIIIQADRMGASIANSLAITADSLRTKRKQRLEALVASASTKMTIPLVLFLMPAIFAVVLTPAVIQVIESLGKLNGFM